MPTVRVCPRCHTSSYGSRARCGTCGYSFQRKGMASGQAAILVVVAAVVFLGIAAWVLSSPTGPSPRTASRPTPQPQAPPAQQTPQPQAQQPAQTPAQQPSQQPATGGGSTSDLKSVIQRASPSVIRVDVRLNQGAAVGSGFVYKEDGRLLTNYHVIEGAREILVTDARGRQAKATVVKADASVDLALLRAPDLAGTPALPVVSSRHLEQGDRVVALGSPEGLTNSVSDGIVSAVNRTIRIDTGTLTDAIQTTAPISHGSSGGPLVELATGSVIGITTAGSETGSNLGFAVSADTILATLQGWGQ